MIPRMQTNRNGGYKPSCRVVSFQRVNRTSVSNLKAKYLQATGFGNILHLCLCAFMPHTTLGII